MLLMGVATVAIGLLPGYATIGVAASTGADTSTGAAAAEHPAPARTEEEVLP